MRGGFIATRFMSNIRTSHAAHPTPLKDLAISKTGGVATLLEGSQWNCLCSRYRVSQSRTKDKRWRWVCGCLLTL